MHMNAIGLTVGKDLSSHTATCVLIQIDKTGFYIHGTIKEIREFAGIIIAACDSKTKTRREDIERELSTSGIEERIAKLNAELEEL